MPPNSRTVYHWIDGKLVRETFFRPDGVKRWPKPRKRPSTLVAIIEPTKRGISVDEGVAGTPDRLARAICDYFGYDAELLEKTPDIGPLLPPQLSARAAESITELITDLTQKFKALGGEETSTGAVISKLEGYTDREDGWSIALKVQKFGPNPKENRIGADFGLIIDIRRDGVRIVKAMLVQAKWAEELPDDITTFDKLEDQLSDMRQQTAESYALIYTAKGVFVYKSDDTEYRFGLVDLFKEGLVCRRGDRSPHVIAQALDRDYVIVFEARQSPTDRR
jgi:hypothetical protein